MTHTRRNVGITAAVLSMACGVIAHYEGFIPQTYADPVGIPTICYGHTGADVVMGGTATVAECQQMLQADVQTAYAGVMRCIGVQLQPHEAAALTSFAFNVGAPALCGSTLARLANSGAPAWQWCPELSKWTYATKAGVKIQLPGLVKRRAAERALCEGRGLSIPPLRTVLRDSVRRVA